MKNSHIGRWFGVVLSLWAATVFAQEPAEPVVLTVLGTNYTAKELGIQPDSAPDLLTSRAFLKIQGGIMGAYIERLDYQPSEEELKEYCRRSSPTSEEMKTALSNSTPLTTDAIFKSFWEDWQRDATNAVGPMQMAAEQLKEWKVARSLHEQYGGRVYVDAFRVPGVPDAVRILMEEREAAGDFTIHDEQLRERFWELMRMPSPVSLVSEEEGRAALAEHPADRQKRQTVKSVSEFMEKLRPANP